MDYDNYVSENGGQIQLGNIFVYDNGVGGNTSYCFLQVVSFVRHSSTPRVIPLESVTTDEKRDMVTDRYTYTVSPGQQFNTVARALNKNKDGFYTWKKECLRPCRLRLYNPEKKYDCIHHYN